MRASGHSTLSQTQARAILRGRGLVSSRGSPSGSCLPSGYARQPCRNGYFVNHWSPAITGTRLKAIDQSRAEGEGDHRAHHASLPTNGRSLPHQRSASRAATSRARASPGRRSKTRLMSGGRSATDRVSGSGTATSPESGLGTAAAIPGVQARRGLPEMVLVAEGGHRQVHARREFVLRCFGAAMMEASTIWPPIARKPTESGLPRSEQGQATITLVERCRCCAAPTQKLLSRHFMLGLHSRRP